MANDKILLPGQRCDGYKHALSCTGDTYREKWVHKEVVKHTGNGEDDFVIEQKPVRIEKVNIQKEIDEAAKKVPSIKELVKQVMDTGDETILVRCKGTYGDVSDMPTDLHEAIAIVNSVKEKGLKVEGDDLLTMSKADIAKLVDEIATKRYEELKAKAAAAVQPAQPGQPGSSGGDDNG